MAISYKPLWKLLIDQNMKKKDLIALSGISQSSVSKMGRGENVNTDILNRHLYRAPLRYRRYNGSDSGRKRRTFLNAGTIKITRIINCKSEVERKHRFRKNVIRTEGGSRLMFSLRENMIPLCFLNPPGR